MRFTITMAAICAISAPALAGEEIRYEATPDWVQPAELPPVDSDPGMTFRLLDRQVRLQDGEVWSYFDGAYAVENPGSLSQNGNVTAQWLPDKGDLIVHRVELVRDGKIIDVLAGGARFEVLRREMQLEQRMLDGMLTATLSVPGLQVGDTLHVSYSTTLRDQALGDQMQWSTGLPEKPFQLVSGRVIASWPKNADIHFKITGAAVEFSETQVGGMNRVVIDLPVAKREDLPSDAPERFTVPRMLQVGTFDSWNAVSATMAPYFSTEGTIAPDGPVAAQVARITGETPDPLARAALATQLVQDDIGYLLNGMDGGNYIPQSPEETWEKRFGDCKAKSLLLLAILRDMGISADVVIVQTSGGDAVSEMLPMPGAFNHMIVRADIGGEVYWLDGTSSGTRLANIANTPRFGYALPIRPGGAALEPIAARPQQVADGTVRIIVDQTAGITVPALVDMEVDFTGALAASLQPFEQMPPGEQRDRLVNDVLGSVLPGFSPYDSEITFSTETGTATVTGSGLMDSPWTMENGRYRMKIPAQPAASMGFGSDRSRPEWKDIPIKINGPHYWAATYNWKLPDAGAGFTLRSGQDVDVNIGGTRIRSVGELADGSYRLDQSVRSVAWEIPASELSTAKREVLRLKRQLPELEAPRDVRRSWDYRGKDRALLDEIEEAFARRVDRQGDDDTSGWSDRAQFRANIGDWSGALKDIDRILAKSPSASNYLWRAGVRNELGDLKAALADMEMAESIDPAVAPYQSQIDILGQLGRGEQGLQVAERYSQVAENPEDADVVMAYAKAWGGDVAGGQELLRDLVGYSEAPGSRYNDVCWFSGLWNRIDAEATDICMKAVEQAQSPSAALDSRALAYFRLGRNADALADLDSALSMSPGQYPSRYLRGVVKLTMGDRSGQDDLDIANAMQPSLARYYRSFGIVPPGG